MWLMTTQGFYSVVQDRSDERILIVRARVRADLEQLLGNRFAIEDTPNADYAFRAPVPRAAFKALMAACVGDISYDNFKNAVADRQGQVRASKYAGVWAHLADLGTTAGPSGGCYCPEDAPKRCSPSDQEKDSRDRQLCCPYDERAMAAYYRFPFSQWKGTSGRRAAMRKRRLGTLEEIAQRAATTRHDR